LEELLSFHYLYWLMRPFFCYQKLSIEQ